jgi:hypothetical protein
MKHLNTTFETPETLETWRRRQPWPTVWGTAVANKQRLGEERRAGAVAMNHTASARRTRRRVVSGGGVTGRQVAMLGRSAVRRGDAVHGEWVREWMQAQRRFERKVKAVTFYFHFRADDSVTCWAIRPSRPTNARPDKTDVLPTTFLIKILCRDIKDYLYSFSSVRISSQI